jgi:small ligand-binding sensory domain FIST
MAEVVVGAGLSTDVDAGRAAAEAATEATFDFGQEQPNLVVAFISMDHRDAAEDVAAMLGERFPAAAVIGCTAEGVIAGARELEHGPAISILAAFLPDTHVRPFGLRFDDDAVPGQEYVGWPTDLSPDAQMLMLCDPFSFPAAHLMSQMNDQRPGTLIIGGIASGGHTAGETRLFYGGNVFTEGALAVSISGRVRVRSLVSQGCRPIGKPVTITRADRNIIFELAGDTPIERINDIWKTASPRDRALMAGGPLFIGRVVNESKLDFDRDDFVVRSVVGADPQSGFIAVGDIVEVGETVQFHVRDPEAADDDLNDRLARFDARAAGVLLFSCNGRGSNMFAEPDHDANAVSKGLGGVPVAGFFANGELGPLAGRNFLHAHTASLAVFVDTA